MSKRDITFIKHIKHEIKREEQSARNNRRSREIQRMNDIAMSQMSERETLHNERCKEAANMDNYERLVNYAGTGDSTYLGTDCKWDLLTRLGLRKRRIL